MKKLNVLLIIALLATAVLAANPPGKLVRLEVINGSGDTVYMRLTGRNTGAFYYLTIPAAWDKTFTILVDSYKRTTWACGGIVSTGSLNMTGNVKLKFVLCGKLPTTLHWADWDGDGVIDPPLPAGSCFPWISDAACSELARRPSFGEPTQEKVVFFYSYTNVFWRRACRPYDIAGIGRCIFNNGFGWFTIWNMIKLPFAIYSRVAFPRGIYMRYRY
jgi:hypothetical protein